MTIHENIPQRGTVVHMTALILGAGMIALASFLFANGVQWHAVLSGTVVHLSYLLAGAALIAKARPILKRAVVRVKAR